MQRLDVQGSDLETCFNVMARGSKTFSLASRLLPASVRQKTTVLYAFCRVSDDLIDTNPTASLRTIEDMKERLDRAYAGAPKDDPVDRAFAALLAAVKIPKELPLALFEGMEWDVTGRRYETIEQLHAYAARVAGTVGAMMTLIMGVDGPIVLERACELGIAMQLTNIARDVGEDARRGRVYLPEAWLESEGVRGDAWLQSPSPTAGVRATVSRLLTHADDLYARSDGGVQLLPSGCRFAIRAARLVYSDIGARIARADYDSISTRAYVPTWRKLFLFMRAASAPRVRTPLIEGASIEAVRSLVATCGGAS